MAITISVGSGKGGTGKSMVLANLAVLLAKKGKKVCVVDLDIGGANAHILFGLFEPEKTLTDFLTRKMDSLTDLICTLESFHGLMLVPGTGDTLQSANMTYQEKKRLLKAIHQIEADIILIDVGAGTSYHSLDFFMTADLQICIAMPEPTAIMDFYRFIQLATMRKALSGFLSHSNVAKQLKNKNFQTINEILDMAEGIRAGASKQIQEELKTFHPLLIINRAKEEAKLNTLKLKKLISKYLTIYLPDLGEIPVDTMVHEALLAYMPICEYSPTSPASLALDRISDKLLQVIALFTPADSHIPHST